MAFTVLFVCTGNVCRSPAAELLFRRLARPGVSATSAGVAALEGAAIDPPTAAALRSLGIDPTPHRARQLAGTTVLAADLVLTADACQRDRLLTEFPTAFRHTFTLKEFTRVVGDPGIRPARTDDPREVVSSASQHRAAARRPGDAAADDIADPYRATSAVALATVLELGRHVDVMVRALRVRRPLPSRPPTGDITTPRRE